MLPNYKTAIGVDSCVFGQNICMRFVIVRPCLSRLYCKTHKAIFNDSNILLQDMCV